MLVLAVVLRRALPRRAARARCPTRGCCASVGALIREEPVLRLPDGDRLPLDGAASAGSGPSIAFLLSGPEYGYSEATIGLFSLAGLAGAAIASLAGRAADRGHVVAGTRLAAAAVLGGWGLIALGETSLAALLAGIVILDLGIQATQILNQSVIFRLRPEARSRLNTAYMTCYFAGAVTGSAGAVARVGARRLARGERGGRGRGRARAAAAIRR